VPLSAGVGNVLKPRFGKPCNVTVKYKLVSQGGLTLPAPRPPGMPHSPSGDRKVGIDIEVVNQKEVTFEVPRDTGDDMVLNNEVHARILRKLDWHLLPLVSLLYFLSFL